MQFSLLNVQRLLTKFTNKLHYNELIEMFQNNDFILFTETWSNALCDLSVDGFSIYQLNRTNRKSSAKRDSGGIALYINKNSAEVDIPPAFGEITTACNVGQAKNGSWCLLEE